MMLAVLGESSARLGCCYNEDVVHHHCCGCINTNRRLLSTTTYKRAMYIKIVVAVLIPTEGRYQ